MFRLTSDDCIDGPTPHVCPTQCVFRVQTVCDLHCYSHIHPNSIQGAPKPWPVQLIATPDAGSYLLGWRGGHCRAFKEAPRSDCVVSSGSDKTITAVFGPTADTTPPTQFSAIAVPDKYHVDVSWSPATDEWLAGYDIFVNGSTTPKMRVSAATTAARLTEIFCESAYTIRVEAYDWTGNTRPASDVATRTLACDPFVAPRPNTAIHVKPPKSTRSRAAFFHYGVKGDVPATKFQCKLDRGRWLACSGRTGKRYRNLKRGYHTFYVRAGNANGFDATPAKWPWRVR
jgi:hypothetical protein